MTAGTSTTSGSDVLATAEVLADPLRREIVRRLADEELCTCHLVEMTGAPQPTVSYHLRILREAGWVHSQPVGRYTYYGLEPGPVAALADAVAELGRRGPGLPRRPACD